jgi:hypothetical protein
MPGFSTLCRQDSNGFEAFPAKALERAADAVAFDRRNKRLVDAENDVAHFAYPGEFVE